MKCSIVGVGSVSAAGVGQGAALATFRSGRPTFATHREPRLPVYAVPWLPDSGPVARFASKRALDRTSLLALHAAREAVERAGWLNRDFSILVGCSRGPTTAWESSFDSFRTTADVPLRTSPLTTLGSIPFALADFFGTGQLSTGMSVTCSSGSHALLQGMALLAAGFTDRVLVGGTEAPLTPFTLRQMQVLRVYDESGGPFPCRPLIDSPGGMVLGEGAAFLALERYDADRELHVLGIGAARERHPSQTGISSDARALQHAMRQAVADRNEPPDAILLHAPGTRRGDAAERQAVAQVFPTIRPRMTSLKWATGHTFGASGPLAMAAADLMLRNGEVWPLPYRTEPSTRVTPSSVLVNATGFGGNAISVLIGRGD